MEDSTIKPENVKNIIALFLYEALGTAILVFTWNFDGHFMAFGVMLAATLCGAITGGHFNPAVSLAVLIANFKFKDNLKGFIILVMAQLIGALFGILMFFTVAHDIKVDEFKERTDLIHNLYPTGRYSEYEAYNTEGQVFWIEFLGTFLLCFIVLNLKNEDTEPTPDGGLKCLTVGFTLLGSIYITAPVSGACLNPALGFAQNLFFLGYQNDHNPEGKNDPVHFMWQYILGPLVAGTVAGLLMKFVHSGLVAQTAK